MATITGTAGDDVLPGTPDNDSISGLAGADNIIGAGGADTLDGGEGEDQIRGGDGNDLILGGAGNDPFMFGEAGDDTIIGGDGDDHLRGGSGVDVFDGGAGLDRVSFFHVDAVHGAIADIRTQTIYDDGYGNVEHMTSIEGLGAGTIFPDLFTGDDGVNLIWVGKGDVGLGFGGADNFIIDEAPALADGGPGNDTIQYFSGIRLVDPDGDGVATSDNATHGVVVNLGLSLILDDGWGGAGLILSFENVGGSDFSDTLTGSAGANTLSGRGGDDLLRGGAGADTLAGDAGNDTLTGGAGADRVVVGAGTGQDSFTDFVHGTDKIAVQGVAGFSDLTLTASAGGTLVTWGGSDSLLLAGVAPAGVTASDFVFG